MLIVKIQGRKSIKLMKLKFLLQKQVKKKNPTIVYRENVHAHQLQN